MNLERIATTASRLLALLREGSVEIAARDVETEQRVAQALDDVERALDECSHPAARLSKLVPKPAPWPAPPPPVMHQHAPEPDQCLVNMFGLPRPRQTPPMPQTAPATTRICTHCAHHRQGAGPSGMQQHDCLHDACRHPVTGSPLDCRVARAAPRAPNDIHGLEFCGPHARHFEQRPQEA
jgi:hypothetical protein